MLVDEENEYKWRSELIFSVTPPRPPLAVIKGR